MLKRFLSKQPLLLLVSQFLFGLVRFKDIENQNKEQKLLKTIKINIEAVEKYTNDRLDLIEKENI